MVHGFFFGGGYVPLFFVSMLLMFFFRNFFFGGHDLLFLKFNVTTCAYLDRRPSLDAGIQLVGKRNSDVSMELNCS